jgi:hypothetical protein
VCVFLCLGLGIKFNSPHTQQYISHDLVEQVEDYVRREGEAGVLAICRDVGITEVILDRIVRESSKREWNADRTTVKHLVEINT